MYSLSTFQDVDFDGSVDCSIMAYFSNRPQVSMVYRLINHAGCW